MRIIDGKDLLLGRLCSKVAKLALLGESIRIVNCQDIVISGSKKVVLKKYLEKIHKGTPKKGPFFPRRPDMITKRTIRSMLPYKRERGRKALKRVRCYIGVPEELKDKKIETIDEINYKKLGTTKSVRLGEISRLLGAKF